MRGLNIVYIDSVKRPEKEYMGEQIETKQGERQVTKTFQHKDRTWRRGEEAEEEGS